MSKTCCFMTSVCSGITGSIASYALAVNIIEVLYNREMAFVDIEKEFHGRCIVFTSTTVVSKLTSPSTPSRCNGVGSALSVSLNHTYNCSTRENRNACQIVAIVPRMIPIRMDGQTSISIDGSYTTQVSNGIGALAVGRVHVEHFILGC